MKDCVVKDCIVCERMPRWRGRLYCEACLRELARRMARGLTRAECLFYAAKYEAAA